MTAPVLPGSRRPVLKRLTGLRAIAALAVFGFHAARHTEWVPQEWMVSLGYTGVSFFFVLSGFVLTWSTSPGVAAATFFRRRFARVYPSHFVTALVALVLPVIAFPVTAPAVVANLLLVQAWFPQWEIVWGLNAVSWSLSCEMFFYLAAPFLLSRLHRSSWRTRLALVGFWYALTQLFALLAAMHSSAASGWAYSNPVIRSGEFVLGVLLAFAVAEGWRPRVPLAAWAAATVVTVLVLSRVAPMMPQSLTDVIVAPLFANVVTSAAVADIRKPDRSVLGSRLLVYGGELSFAFYLVHELVLFNIAGVLGQAAGGARGVLWLCVAGLLSVVLAMLLHHGVERPCQRVLRGRPTSSRG